MDQKEIKRIFSELEEEIGNVYDISKFLHTICESEFANEIGQYLHIITQLIYNKIDRIEVLRIELKQEYYE